MTGHRDECGHRPHSHDEAEFALCRRLSKAAFKKTKELGLDSWKGSAAPGLPGYPFFIVANKAEENSTFSEITPKSIQTAFAGTIHPLCRIEVSPMTRHSKWANEIRDYYMKEEPEKSVNVEFMTQQTGSQKKALAELERLDELGRTKGEHWLELSDWFQAQTEMHDVSVVSFLTSTTTYDIGPVYLRLVVGLTDGGSLAGLYYDPVYA